MRGAFVLLALLPFLPLLPAQGAAPGAFALPQFAALWQRTDGPVAGGQAARSWLWGPTPGTVQTEPFAGAPGGLRTVQYFDKARMEANPDAAPGSRWATTTGLLVVEMTAGRVQVGPDQYEDRQPADLPVAGDATVPAALAAAVPTYRSFHDVASLPGGPDRRAPSSVGAAVTATIDAAGSVGSGPDSGVRVAAYTPETGHNIPDVFAQFMQSQGLVDESGQLRTAALMDPVYVLGYPISEAYWATVPVAGQPTRVLIQLFQRRVLTYIPGYSGGWQVQMGNTGRDYYAWRYTVPPPPPTATPVPGANDQFVHVAGNHFTLGGQPVLLKGTNYWQQAHPFADTWLAWDGAITQAQLAVAASLGVNTIRIGLPYDNPSTVLPMIWGADCGPTAAACATPHGWLPQAMTQLLQIAAGYHMKVLFTLFEWNNDFPAPGTPTFARQQAYVQSIVAPFANDDRVLGWDLHNEPENYGRWDSGAGGAAVIDWAAAMAGVVRRLDAHHPLTVGLADYRDLWLAPAGRSFAGIVDFVSFHCYDAGGLRTQIDALTARTGKPVLLEEMGWPTGPAKLSSSKAVYDEPTQSFLYHTMLDDAKASTLAGVIQWQLEDLPIGTLEHYIKPSIEAWFGLVRRDGSLKPAAALFRDLYPAPPLPSSTVSNLPLSRAADLAR